MIIFLKLILLIIFTHQSLFWIYLWQVKEYRSDRFFDALNSHFDIFKAIKNQYNLFSWFRPQPTFRAILSTLLSLLITIFLIKNLSFFTTILVTLLIPLICSFSILIFHPIFYFLKQNKIKKATEKMSHFSGTVIGVTGSYGKSSTKEILATILSAKFKVAKTQKNNNSEIGVAQTVLNLKNNPQIFIVEMGAYHRGEIQAICNIVKPTIGIITGLGDQHLSLFGSLENIKKTKYELINSLPKNGYSLIAQKDFNLTDAQNIKSFPDHVEFDYNKHHFSLPLLGQDLIRNVIGAIKIAQHLGLSLPEIQAALSKLNPSEFYPKLITVKPNIFIIDDSYNSSLESFLSALNYLSTWKDYQKVLVTPGIIELGSHSQKDHLLIGKQLKFIDSVIVTQPQSFQELHQFNNTILITKTGDIISRLKSLKKNHTVFLFKGRVPSTIINLLRHE